MENMVDKFQKYKGKNVLITGHTGFKGSWLSQILKYLGANVYGYSLNTNNSQYNFLDKIDEKKNDILNKNELKKYVDKVQPDIIFHLAAQSLVIESYLNPSETYLSNVIGTLNVLDVFSKSNSNSLVVVTTDKVYENNENGKPFVETDRLGGNDMYSSSKACCEILTQSYVNSFLNINEYGVKHSKLVSTVRAGNVIGGGDWNKNRLFTDLFKSVEKNEPLILRNPNSTRPWQHVLDCLDAYIELGVKLMDKKTEYASSWNIAPPIESNISVLDLIKKCKSAWNKVEYKLENNSKFYESQTLMLDNSKFKSEFSWEPKLNIDESINKTIIWYKNFLDYNKIITIDQIKEYYS